MEFDHDVERGDAFRRIGNRNRVGRKHNHQPRGRALQKKLRRATMKHGPNSKRMAALRRYTEAVAAYWRCEVDDHPRRPTGV